MLALLLATVAQPAQEPQLLYAADPEGPRGSQREPEERSEARSGSPPARTGRRTTARRRSVRFFDVSSHRT